MAGHHVTLVCRSKTAELINTEGTRVRMHVKAIEQMIEIDSRQCSGKLNALTPEHVKPKQYDLACLAMQEPQYGEKNVPELMKELALSKISYMSIMNMPPLSYLARIASIDVQNCRPAYLDPEIWDAFEPSCMTLCSPDPQAFRLPNEQPNVLQVGLPTNFKVAKFDSPVHNAMLAQLDADMSAARWDFNGQALDLPIKLKLHDSLFVPLAKWSMLMTGNYRCILSDGIQSIQQSVHADIEKSQSIYEWVSNLCMLLGARGDDQVAFQKYAQAAQGLLKPSSAARALDGGAVHIERIDLLIKLIADQHEHQSDVVDEIVRRVNGWLDKNCHQTTPKEIQTVPVV